MVHPIEQKINSFLKTSGKPDLTLVTEFQTRVGAALADKFFNDPTKASPFSLRMSNIGLPLRQLCLQRDYGRVVQPNSVKFFYGSMLESLMLFLLRASGVNVLADNKKVILDVNGFKLPGELDLVIDNAVWDVKSASDYAYKTKFESYETLESNDSFGYMGQGFGYAMAENLPFAGWIVINKADGSFKIVTVPDHVQKFYKEKFYREFDEKIKHVTGGNTAPKCWGVVPEFFRRKDTGNKILGNGCEWCDYKDKCHPGVITMPSLVSEAKDKPIKHYIKVDKKYNV